MRVYRRCCLIVGAILCAQGFAQEAERATTIDVRVDPGVELLSVLFRLAGSPEYGQGRVEAYTKAVEEHFGSFRTHAAVNLAADLRRRQSVSYDAVMSFAVHLDGTAKFAPQLPLEPRPEALDARWQSSAPRFLRAAQRFAKKSKFAEFFAANAKLYATAVERMRARLEESAELDWFDEFFGARPTAQFRVSLGLLNGGACYGPRVLHADGREDLHCVLGVWKTDDEGLPVFGEDVILTVVHEFCHSYCNHLIDAHEEAMAASGKQLFAHVADAMRKQAYGNWQTMLKESLVRACVIRYAAITKGPRARQLEVGNQKARSFHWAGELSDLLADYEDDRDTYPTLADFMPKIVTFFDEYAPQFEQRLARAPRVVAMVPENGARDVDPDTDSIVVTFSKKMADKSWAFVGGGPKFPKTTGKPSYDAARKVLTLPVKLQPGHEYEFWLNRGKYNSFRSADGHVLQSVHVTFRTAEE